jgi:gas vesicle protein
LKKLLLFLAGGLFGYGVSVLVNDKCVKETVKKKAEELEVVARQKAVQLEGSVKEKAEKVESVLKEKIDQVEKAITELKEEIKQKKKGKNFKDEDHIFHHPV